jgi:hypothetical protein
MSAIGSGSVVALREEIASEQLETVARDLVEKHWPEIDRAGEDDRDAFAALGAEAKTIAHDLKLSPDAIDKFCELALADIKARTKRKLAREVVEEFWRTLISVGESSRTAAEAQEKLAALEKAYRNGIEKIVQSLSPIEARVFRETVEEEDSAVALLHRTDRAACFSRLGLTDKTAALPIAQQHHQGLGEFAVKTAVRAAVWEGVRALFRAI